MFLSNRKLRLLIITMLLFIFCMFLGLFNVKAENMFNYEPSSWYCPNGIFQNNQVLEDKRFYGCSTNSTGAGALRSEITYSGFNNGNYDISGQFVVQGQLEYIAISANNVACFITTDNVDNTNTNPGVINYYCFNVEVDSGSLKLETFGDLNGSFPPYKFGFARTWYLTSHFDKANSNVITNIQNNTQNISNSINDSSIDSNGTSSNASDWNNKNATNGTITNLLTLPITLLQAIVNGLQTSCSSFSLGTLFGTSLSLPCINLSNLLGSTLFNVIDVLISGLMIYAIAKKLIKIFNDFTNLKTNQVDELYGGGN